MSRFPLKIVHHTKIQEDLTLNEKRRLKDTQEMTEMLGYLANFFKAAII